MSVAQLMHTVMAETPLLPLASVTVFTELLTSQEETEVIAFLAERPLHTVCMAGFIRDNGLESPLNRGRFYGCRNSEGRLEGVALIGHATLIEARTSRAMKEFALIAQSSSSTHMILGEEEQVELFWDLYADRGQEMRLSSRELLFELKRATEIREPVEGLRLATLEDLELILPVHAQLAFAESGINPLESDPEGFRNRCAIRIEKGRVWVVVSDQRLIFKADIQADTPDVIYLEGIFAEPAERGKGLAGRCLSQLAQNLLRRTKSICVLVNEERTSVHSFYRLANFKCRESFLSIFLHC
jgi:uncharacterized protein